MMTIRYGLSIAALAALVGGSMPALAQQTNTPTDPTAPSGARCTGFPGDPVECGEVRPNTTIPEKQAPQATTPSGFPDVNTLPDMPEQQDLRRGSELNR